MEENQTETSKNRKKGLFIGIIIVLLLVMTGGFAYYISNKDDKKENKKELVKDWGDLYYDYIQQASESDNKETYGLEEGATNYKIKFLKSKDNDNPSMILSYKLNNEERASIFYIIKDKIENYNLNKKSKVQLLYNIEEEEYNWYLITEDNNTEALLSVSNIIQGNKTTAYTFKSSDTTKREDLFVEVEVDDNQFEIEDLNNKEELKKSIRDVVTNFKTDEKILTSKIKEQVIKKVEEIKEAKNGLKVGNYTLKYGDYECDVKGTSAGGTYTINKDGTFSWKCDWENYMNEKYTDIAEGKYEVYYSKGDEFDPTNSWIIKFTFEKYHSTYEPSNSYPHDFNAFDVTKDNTFQYRQSEGTFTYKVSSTTNESTNSTTNINSSSSSNASVLTPFEYDTSVNLKIPNGEYTRLNSSVHTGNLKISNTTGNSFDFEFDCIYMTQAGYPNLGNMKGTAKAIKGNNFVYTEHESGNYGYDYNIFFYISGEGDNIKIKVEDECYDLKGNTTVNPHAGMNVTFEGEYKK